MVSLWGSSNKNNNADDESQEDNTPQPRASSSQSQNARNSEDANERTRLIPHNEQPRGGYLHPDDPAVRPPVSTYKKSGKC